MRQRRVKVSSHKTAILGMDMPRKYSLRMNMAALFAVQIASYAAPLVTLPWLTRVLGPSNFGRLTFCVAVTSYFVLFADYGFNLSATRQIAVCSTDRVGRSRVFWHTITVKALLALAGFPLMLLLTLCGHRFAAERTLLIINYLTVLGAVLTPTWYFMGTERQALLSGIMILMRVVSIPAIFLLVRSSADIQIAALIPSAMTVLGGMVCCLVLIGGNELERVKVTAVELSTVLREGWHLFVSTASISLYQATNTVVLGLVAGTAAVGQYSAAEKVLQACQGLLTPIGQSAYPRVSRLMQESRNSAFALIRRILKIQGSVALVLSILLFLAASPLIRLLYGPRYSDAVNVLHWLSALPFLVALSNVFGVQTMLAMGLNRLVSRILVIAGAINVLSLFVLTHWFGATGAAMAVSGTELFVTLVMAFIVMKHDWPVFRVPLVT